MTRMRVFVFLAISGYAMAQAETGQPPRAKSAQEMVGPWQLFIDDELISSRTNVVRRYHSFRKHAGNPILVIDRPWEWSVVKVTSVLPEEDGSGYRMYYGCWTAGDKSKKWGSFACYATSKDGIKWEKPNLGLYEWTNPETNTKTKDNNIVPTSPAYVMRTPWEPDPNKHYQGVGGGYHAYSSPDGLHWKKESTKPIVTGGDTSHFYWDPHTKLFRCNVKGGSNAYVGDEVSGLRRRCVGFSESANLLQFPPLRMIMAPDDTDDLWCKPDTVQRTHFYACHVLPYETAYVGFLQIFRAEEPEGYFHGPLWLELVTSRDGIHWLREESDTRVHSATAMESTSRPPLLDIGKYRTFDHGMVIAPPPILVGDELRLYYTGYDEEHDLLPYHSAIGLATLRKDGFVSLDADERPGEVVTKQLKGAGGELQVNYEAPNGTLRVEVLGSDGRVLPGYGREECQGLTGDAVRQPVKWKTRSELPAEAGAIRLRFLLEHGRLYSFMAGTRVEVIEEPVTPLQALYTFEGSTDAWSDMLGEDGLQALRNLGTCTIDYKKADPAFGKHSLVVGSPWRPWNRAEIEGTSNLGRHFTLAAMVKSTDNKHSRLFSAYNGNHPTNTSELIFDFDPRGKVVNGMRLVCKGIEVQSNEVTFADNKYHHLAVVYDDGLVAFYLDGKSAGRQWIPGGDPVKLARNLLVGEDAERGSDEQLAGNVDDVLILGRALGEQDIASLSRDGAAAFFNLKDQAAGPSAFRFRTGRLARDEGGARNEIPDSAPFSRAGWYNSNARACQHHSAKGRTDAF